MSNTVFVDQTTIIVAAWLNDINNVVYNLLGNGTIVPATVAALRTNIGLGTIATQNASAVAITGGTITGTTFTGNITGNASGSAASITGVNPVANGGTGLSTTTAWSPVLTGTTATGNFKADLGPGTAGQVLTSAGAGAYPAWAAPTTVTLATPQATTSGTSIDFTSIPSGVKRITIMLNGVSTNGTSIPIIQIGDSGGIETSGYNGCVSSINAGGAAGTETFSTGFMLNRSGVSTDIMHGELTLSLLDSSTNTWVASGGVSLSNANFGNYTSGSKATSAVLDRVRLTTVSGAGVFDAGSVNIQYA